MSTSRFSAELHAELVLSLEAYADLHGAPRERERLDAAADSVCREAHARGMRPEAMVVAVHAAYEAISPVLHDVGALRSAYDRLVSGCIRAYFEAVAKPTS